MRARITDKDLEALADRINTALGAPMDPWTGSPEGCRANIGNYHLSHAYGRVSLVVMTNERGAVRRVLGSSTKRELYNEMQAFLAGLEMR